MFKRLNITNGDNAAGVIRASPIDGDVLSWQDPLYEGAVPAGLDLNEVSTCRAEYLSAAYPNERNQAVEIQERNRLFRNAGTYDQVILWFEHDLVDQLQLLQILDGFTGACPPLLDLICIDNHPGVSEFRGIGQLHPTQAPALMDARAPITDKQFTLAQAGWAAFRSPDPRDVENLLDGDTTNLPFLAPALTRHLEEFPSFLNGLGRTERQLLELVAEGHRDPLVLFIENTARESHLCIGDWSTFRRLATLCDGPNPLLRCRPGPGFRHPPRDQLDIEIFRSQRLSLTVSGEEVLEGKADATALKPTDHWLGGVHLRDDAPLWRWDRHNRELIKIA